jgi:oligopeptide/dipeptide ABC transporter ATP-binding protein
MRRSCYAADVTKVVVQPGDGANMDAMAKATPPLAVLAIEALRLIYRGRSREVCAVENGTLEVRPGEAVGLIGESGSGKSSIARAALGLLQQGHARVVGGRVLIEGRDMTGCDAREWRSVRGHPIASVFQDPLSFLNPVMRVGRQIAESIRLHDTRALMQPRIEELLGLVRLDATVARCYPHELSGGMRQRVLLAIALACRPRLLIADEPTTALDVTTQAEILALLRDLRERLGMALLLISHDLGAVAHNVDRIYVMYAGRTIEWGTPREVFAAPAHPYTTRLLLAAKATRDADGRFPTIDGEGPSLAAGHGGCPFQPRCPEAVAHCATAMPPVVRVGTTHDVLCWQRI